MKKVRGVDFNLHPYLLSFPENLLLIYSMFLLRGLVQLTIGERGVM